MHEYRLGRLAGLELSTQGKALWGSLALFALLTAAGLAALSWPPVTALLAALLGVALHWLSELWHQLGHAWAARRTGYPMQGVRFGFLGVLSSSLYPAGEPELPASVHIRRALGGPLASTALAIAAALLALALRGTGGLPFWLAAFMAAENLLVFGLGALLPLGFNDGSTLLHWWGRRAG